MKLGEHNWTCPECGKTIRVYTEGALVLFREEHQLDHIRKNRSTQENKIEYIEYVGPRKNYDVLELNLADIGFLKTRGVALDDKIELDLVRPYTPVYEYESIWKNYKKKT